MATSNSNKTPAAANGPTPVAIKVHSLPVRFRRAGLAFTQTPKTIPIKELTDEQLEALEKEPMLSVVPVFESGETA